MKLPQQHFLRPGCNLTPDALPTPSGTPIQGLMWPPNACAPVRHPVVLLQGALTLQACCRNGPPKPLPAFPEANHPQSRMFTPPVLSTCSIVQREEGRRAVLRVA